MLVLGIRFGERIFVGDDVVISLEQIAGGVRLGFAAPPAVRIERECVRIRRRMKAGESLREIEDDLDWRDNQNVL